jgi:hypothetical protein
MWCHRQPRRLAIVRCRSGCGRPGGRYRGAAQCQRLERQRGSGPACAMYLHHCGAIVCDCLATVGVDHEQVTAVRAESALDCRLDGEAGVDVGDDLSSALGLVGAYKDQHLYTEAASSHSPSRSTTMVGVWPPNDMMAVWKKRKLGGWWARSLQTSRSLQRWSRGVSSQHCAAVLSPRNALTKIGIERRGSGRG